MFHNVLLVQHVLGKKIRLKILRSLIEILMIVRPFQISLTYHE